MKKYFIILVLFVLFISPCFSQEDLEPAYPHEITCRDGITNYNEATCPFRIAYYKGKPFTGLLVLDEKTNKKMGEFKEGYKNGLFTEYYTNGKKKSEGKYIKGIKDGIYIEWNETGDKIKETIFKEGLTIRENLYRNNILESSSELKTEYFSNSKKKSEGLMKNVKKEGLYKRWYESNQNIYDIANYRSDILDGEYLCYDERGNIISKGAYENGIKQGYWIGNGYIEEISSRNNEEGNYINGKKDGKWKINGTNINFLNDKQDFYYGARIKDYINKNMINSTNLLIQFSSSSSGHKNYILYSTGAQKGLDKGTFEYDVANSVFKTIMNTKRFIWMKKEYVQQHTDDTIFFALKCSNISIGFENFSQTYTSGNTVNGYRANITFRLVLEDYEGKNIDSKTVVLISPYNVPYSTKEDAYNKAKNNKVEISTLSIKKIENLEGSVEAFIDNNFPINSFITNIEEKNSTNEAKQVSISGGNNIGIYKNLYFKVYDEINSNATPIGELKVTSVGDNSSICKVKDGGVEILSNFNSGKKLYIISSNNK